MAPNRLQLDPYQSNIPVVQIPPTQQEPAPLPVEAGHTGKAGGIAYFGDKLLRGFMEGRDLGAAHKAQQAQYSMGVAKENEDKAFQTYQDALRTGQAKQGDANDPAYQAYIKAQDAGTQLMKQYAIPEEKKGAKKQQGQGQKKDGSSDQMPPTMGGRIMDFMKANPHFVPQLALAMRVPNKPVMTADTEETKNTLASQGNQLTMQGQQIEQNTQRAKQEKEEQQRATAERAVEEAGGAQAVRDNPNASPDQRQAANRMYFSAVDKMSPDGQLKFGLEQKVKNGVPLTASESKLAGAFGFIPEPKEVKMTGKNGHEMQMLVDPTTNQPIPGSKPLDLGPPQWAQQYYGERAAEKRDIQNAVSKNPETYGITLTGDKKTDAARIDAATTRLFAESEEHIKATAGLTGKTGYEVQRDNAILEDTVKELKGRFPGGAKNADEKVKFAWPGEKNGVDISAKDASAILNQFVEMPTSDQPGKYTFRTNPELQSGKDAGAAERDRKWAYQLVKDRMMVQKGKKAMTAQEADALLSQTALGRPITSDQVRQNVMTRPPEQTGGTLNRIGAGLKYGLGIGPDGTEKSSGPMTPPPEQQSAAPQGEPQEGAIARNSQGVTLVYVNGQWLNQETMQPQ